MSCAFSQSLSHSWLFEVHPDFHRPQVYRAREFSSRTSLSIQVVALVQLADRFRKQYSEFMLIAEMVSLSNCCG